MVLAEGAGQAPRATKPEEPMPAFDIDPLLAAAVMVATACTDAIYVLFMNAVVRRRRLPAASWSSVWYLLSSFAIINYTHNWHYVAFAAAGSFIGAYLTVTFINTEQPAPNRRAP
jgi:uncharacterized membrane protein YhaH (DUF805 family)